MINNNLNSKSVDENSLEDTSNLSGGDFALFKMQMGISKLEDII